MKMSDVKIISNYHWRKYSYIWELSEVEQAEIRSQFDWIDSSDTVSWDETQFIKYRNHWYCDQDFMSLHNKFYCPNLPEFMHGWDGYLNDSFFSGVLIKYSECGEMVQLATFYS